MGSVRHCAVGDCLCREQGSELVFLPFEKLALSVLDCANVAGAAMDRRWRINITLVGSLETVDSRYSKAARICAADRA
jgi:hypothetical protein